MGSAPPHLSIRPFTVEQCARLGHERAMRLYPSLSIAAPFLILLGSCVGPAQERARPAAPRPIAPSPVTTRPAPVATPAPAHAPASVEWQYRPATPGNWTYRADPAGSVALFGQNGADPQLTIRCDRAARRISLIRAGTGTGAMILRTSYGATSWPTTPAPAAAPQTLAVRAASDATLDQIAYSRGKFAIEATGLPPLIVPAWAEMARVVEDCRG